MKFRKLLSVFGSHAWFEWSTVVQVFDEPRSRLRTQLHRWCEAGRLVRLRRGMYSFAEEYRKQAVNPAKLANALYHPSYLSLHWALAYYGLIPEQVITLTSVTPRQTTELVNTFGNFDYRHIKQSRFWGYRKTDFHGGDILMACPEKALLDLWYLDRGEWTVERMEEMRFQNFEVIDMKRLLEMSMRFDSRKVDRSVESWKIWSSAEMEGVLIL